MRNLLSLVVFTIWVFLVIIGPDRAFGSSRRSMGLKTDTEHVAPAPTVGICGLTAALHGYKCQEYQVTTDDGYILSLQRIPEGRGGGGGGGGSNRPPVLLQHGVLVDGMTWLLNSPDESLGYILADNGFDVWIANTRGTRFSRGHVNLDSNNPDYWDWTWDDLVSHDLPTVIDFMFTQTGQKIHYVGHSLGTLMALAAFSEGEVEKVKSAAMLSPVAYLSHMTTPLGILAARAFVGEVTSMFGLAEFNPKGEPVANFLKTLCLTPGVDCYDLLTAFTGRNCCLNSSTVELFLKNEPQSTSTKNMIHMAQTVRDGYLKMYDYGNPNFNLAHYGKMRPPIYNLSNIPRDFPMFFSYGGQDALADGRDVATLLDSLKLHDTNKLSVQFIENFAHADFIMGITAKDIVYNQVISFFRHHH